MCVCVCVCVCLRVQLSFYDSHNLLYLPSILRSAVMSGEVGGMIWFSDSCAGLGCDSLCFFDSVTL